MTVEITFQNVDPVRVARVQVRMSKQIEEQENFPIVDITRHIRGNTLILEVETDLPSQAVDNIVTKHVPEWLNDDAEHVETREA